MKRPLWLGAGMVIGVGGTLWAEQRLRRGVRRAVARVAPNEVAVGAARSARELGERVRSAVDAGREERARREEELWEELAGRGTPPGTRARTLQGGGRTRR